MSEPDFKGYYGVKDISPGFSTQVYEALRHSGNRRVIIKYCRRDTAMNPLMSRTGRGAQERLDRFIENARLQQHLGHEYPDHFVGVLDDVVTTPESAWYASPHCEQTLQDWIDRGTPPEQIRRVILGIIEALVLLYDKEGRGHGNLRPGNVMLPGSDSDHLRILLSDARSDPATDGHHGLADDLKSIGRIILSLVLSDSRTDFDSLGWSEHLAKKHEWKRSLGKDAPKWIGVVRRLLTTEWRHHGGAHADDDLDKERSKSPREELAVIADLLSKPPRRGWVPAVATVAVGAVIVAIVAFFLLQPKDGVIPVEELEFGFTNVNAIISGEWGGPPKMPFAFTIVSRNGSPVKDAGPFKVRLILDGKELDEAAIRVSEDWTQPDRRIVELTQPLSMPGKLAGSLVLLDSRDKVVSEALALTVDVGEPGTNQPPGIVVTNYNAGTANEPAELEFRVVDGETPVDKLNWKVQYHSTTSAAQEMKREGHALVLKLKVSPKPGLSGMLTNALDLVASDWFGRASTQSVNVEFVLPRSEGAKPSLTLSASVTTLTLSPDETERRFEFTARTDPPGDEPTLLPEVDTPDFFEQQPTILKIQTGKYTVRAAIAPDRYGEGKFTVEGYVGESARQRLQFTLNRKEPPNLAPSITSISSNLVVELPNPVRLRVEVRDDRTTTEKLLLTATNSVGLNTVQTWAPGESGVMDLLIEPPSRAVSGTLRLMARDSEGKEGAIEAGFSFLAFNSPPSIRIRKSDAPESPEVTKSISVEATQGNSVEIPLHSDDTDTPAEKLKLTHRVVSGQELIQGPVTLRRSGSDWTLVINPADRKGKLLIELTISDDGNGGPFSKSSTETVEIKLKKVPPVIALPPALTVPGGLVLVEGQSTNISFGVSDLGTPSAQIELKLSVTDVQLLPLVWVTNRNGKCELFIQTQIGKTGKTELTLTATDKQGLSASHTFPLSIQANQPNLHSKISLVWIPDLPGGGDWKGRGKGAWVGEIEVTQTEWALVMANNPSKHPGAKLPAHNFAWNDAQSFCKLLTKMEHDRRTIDLAWEFRLPTIEQWKVLSVGVTQKTSVLKENQAIPPLQGRQRPGTIVGGATLYDVGGNVREFLFDPSPWDPSQILAVGSSHMKATGAVTAFKAHVLFYEYTLDAVPKAQEGLGPYQVAAKTTQSPRNVILEDAGVRVVLVPIGGISGGVQ